MHAYVTAAGDREAILETRSRSRITAVIGLLLALLGAFKTASVYRQDATTATIAGVSGAIHLGMALAALRTHRYEGPAAIIAVNGLLGVALADLLNRAGPAHALDSMAVLFLVLLPQLGMYLLGTGSGIAMGVGASAYLSSVFGWLLLHPARVVGPVSDLTNKYIFAEAALLVSFVVNRLYVRARSRMVAALGVAHATADALRLAEQRRLEEDLDLAARIQTALLPRDLHVEGLTLSASMLPAAEVGGDYYDVLPFESGAWLCIGDVAGHGLNAGLTMLMIQSAVSALTHDDPARGPDQALCALNAALYRNIRQRLGRDEHATLTLLRYQRDGNVVFAGAHEEILVFRATARRCETFTTPGPWVGARPDVTSATATSRLTLGDGDVLVLYTDGLTEARDGAREPFGLERVEAAILGAEGQPVDAIRQAILDAARAFGARFDDDVTLLVARYHAPVSA